MPAIEISIYSILLWLTAILIASLDVVIFLGSRSFSSRIFAVFTFLVALWSAAQGFFIAFDTSIVPFFLVKLQHFLGIVISLGFLYFSLVYPDDKKPRRNSFAIFALSLVGVVFFVLFFLTPLLLSELFPIGGIQRWGWKFGELQRLFDVTFYGLWIAVLTNIYHKWRGRQGSHERTNLKYMFWGLAIGIIPPGILNVFLPSIGDFEFNWMGPIASGIWIYIIGYSIIKYRQMNVRLVLAEVLVIGMTAAFFVNIFTDLPIGILGRLLIFAIFACLGYFLIKSAIRISTQREQLRSLNESLQQKVDAQTKEIQRAYEVERKARIELERLNQNKNDFIVITQHHLRTPLAQIRWYADSIKNGLYGTVSAELGTAVSRIDSASEKLIKTLNNFLEVVQMKISAKILDIHPTNLRPILEVVLNELAGEIKEKKLSITFPADDSSWPLVLADPERIKDVFSILIDNAVRYNQDGGSVEITTEKKRGIFLFNLSNTGIGLSEDDKERLLKHSFFRSKGAKRAHPTGMGVGLLVAKTIIEAHNGRIKVEEGKQGQTTFSVTLTLAG